MGKKKKRSESDEEITELKRINTQSSPGGLSQAISQLCGQIIDSSDSNSGEGGLKSMEGQTSQTGHTGPTNSDIIAMLGKIHLKLNDMDDKLKKLDGLEKKVDSFDKDLKKLWLHIDTFTKETRDKITMVDHKVDSVDIELEGARKRIADLEKDKTKMKDDMNYMQSQTMRNNLIFGNIPEEANETPVRSEKIIRDFIISKLKIAKEEVDNMRFERVHRMGQKIDASSAGERGGVRNSSRSIVCKFSFFGDREKVRGSSKNLRGTQFYVSEQFPPEVAAKRRRLFRKAKEEKLAGRKAWVSYDTLFVDGKPVRDA